LGETDHAHGGNGYCPHGIHIAEGIRSRHPAEYPRVIAYRWKKVDRLHKCQSIGQPVYPTIFRMREITDEIGIRRLPQIAQGLVEQSRTQFGSTSGKSGKLGQTD